MCKSLKIFTLIIFYCFISCSHYILTPVPVSKIHIIIPQSIPIDEAKLFSMLRKPGKFNSSEPEFTAEIVITHYSSGKEIFVLSEKSKGNIIESSTPGIIEGIVKLRRRNKLEKVLFIKAIGNSKEVIVKNFANEINNIIIYIELK